MSYFYNLYSYYVWGENVVEKLKANDKPLSLISRNELMEKIALITKNRKEPQVIEGYGLVKEKKIEIVFISKKSESIVKIKTEIHVTNEDMLKSLKSFKFKKMRKDAVADKSWTKVAETSEEQKRSTLEEIARIKKNLSNVKYHAQSFKEEWKNMTKYDKNKWRLNGKKKKRRGPGRPRKNRAKVRE